MTTKYDDVIGLDLISEEQLEGLGHIKYFGEDIDEGCPAYKVHNFELCESTDSDFTSVYSFTFVYRDKTYTDQGYVINIYVTKDNKLKLDELCPGINDKQLKECLDLVRQDLEKRE